MIRSLFRSTIPALLVALASVPALAADTPAPATDTPKVDAPKEDAAAKANAYPLDYCATCGPGEKEELVTKTHKGRDIKMCKGCVKIFNADPEGYVKKVDKVIKEAAKSNDAKKTDAEDPHKGHDHKDGEQH
jgi:hypothetical protein